MIYLGADHGGYALKEEIKAYLDEQEIPFVDCGTDSKELRPHRAKDLPKNAGGPG